MCKKNTGVKRTRRRKNPILDAQMKSGDVIRECLHGVRVLQVSLTDPEHMELLKQMEANIETWLPTNDKDKNKLENKIHDELGDVKIAVVKAQKSNDYSDVDNQLNRLKVMIADRTL